MIEKDEKEESDVVCDYFHPLTQPGLATPSGQDKRRLERAFQTFLSITPLQQQQPQQQQQ